VPAGVRIRTGFVTASGEHVVSGLIQRLGSLDFISDNAGSFANGTKWPRNGGVMLFGSHRIYVGTVLARRYPTKVLVAPDPPRPAAARGSRTDRTAGSVELMMAGATDAAKGAAGEEAAPTRSRHQAKHPLERDENIAGTSNVPPVATPLQAAMDVLSTPIAPNADAAATQAELEAQRQTLLNGAADIARAQ
jgi:hypothetical protein